MFFVGNREQASRVQSLPTGQTDMEVTVARDGTIESSRMPVEIPRVSTARLLTNMPPRWLVAIWLAIPTQGKMDYHPAEPETGGRSRNRQCKDLRDLAPVAGARGILVQTTRHSRPAALEDSAWRRFITTSRACCSRTSV